MAWKFKRYRIKWSAGKKKFKKVRRDRKRSYEAHVRWRKNRSKMKSALRKSRMKRKITMRKNKSKGIYKKLDLARKRYKHILKSDINMNAFVHNLLYEAKGKDDPYVLELSDADIKDIKYSLQQIKDEIELDDKIEQEELNKFIDDAIEYMDDFDDIDEIKADDEEFLSDVISFIEEFAEEAGILIDDDEEEEKNEDLDFLWK